MREIAGTTYRLVGLDTNVLSVMLKTRNIELRNFVNESLATNALPCISAWTLLELRKTPRLYEGFQEFFSVYPLVLIKPPNQLRDDEMSAYPDPSSISPILFVFSPLHPDPESRLRAFMTRLFSDSRTLDAESQWDAWKTEVLQSIESLKGNFPPRQGGYSAEDAARFISMGVPQHLMLHSPSWSERVIERHGDIRHEAFPSLKMYFYTVFYRFYAEQRRPQPQDVFDIAISGMAPYMDIVICENFQAEIFRKVKRRDPFISHLDVRTLGDLRN